MQHYPDDFVQTGQNLPVSVEQLVKYVHMELDRYDNLVKMTESIPNYTPYSNPIIFTTEEGKQVQIPEQIQQEAVKVWVNAKSQNEQGDDYIEAKKQYEELQESPYGREYQQQENIMEESNISNEPVIPEEYVSQPIQVAPPVQTASVNQKSDNTFLYLVIAIALILFLYYCYKNKKFDGLQNMIGSYNRS